MNTAAVLTQRTPETLRTRANDRATHKSTMVARQTYGINRTGVRSGPRSLGASVSINDSSRNTGTLAIPGVRRRN
ncbi:hypothetical protein D9M72_454680 [compost metagenome]